MKAVVNGVAYDIMFEHRETAITVGNRVLIDTICHISEEDVNKRGNERFTFLASGRALQSKKDKFNRWKGKKIAFARALNAAKFSRPERLVFWSIFFSYFPKAKDKKYCNN